MCDDSKQTIKELDGLLYLHEAVPEMNLETELQTDKYKLYGKGCSRDLVKRTSEAIMGTDKSQLLNEESQEEDDQYLNNTLGRQPKQCQRDSFSGEIAQQDSETDKEVISGSYEYLLQMAKKNLKVYGKLEDISAEGQRSINQKVAVKKKRQRLKDKKAKDDKEILL
ncbi:hypothetical protein Tco_1317097 [Tanacetum coccineum]